jgi:hypothetical protein
MESYKITPDNIGGFMVLVGAGGSIDQSPSFKTTAEARAWVDAREIERRAAAARAATNTAY